MRFYFHLEGGDERVLDDEGLELTDLDLARRHALVAAAEIAADDLKRGFEHIEPRIRITDQTGEELASIAVEASLKSRA